MKVVLFALGGVVVGLVFSLAYGVIALFTGGMPTPDGSVISPIAAAAMYLVTCGTGGVLVGLLHPLLRTITGSAVAGSIGIAPLLIGSVILYEGLLGAVDWRFVIVGSILIGAPIGIAVRREYKSFQPRD